jgi:hypothetical protein
VDFVGYFETLSQDFATVCDRIGVAPPLPRHNRSNHSDYRQFYTDDLRELVARRLAKDIEFLGYEFDGVSAERRQELQSTGRMAA